uniref:Uncharacterized protein n=1 Tax=Glossina pallidipes TaxID=7398 RepID=A0A1B0A2R7_GLOPL
MDSAQCGRRYRAGKQHADIDSDCRHCAAVYSLRAGMRRCAIRSGRNITEDSHDSIRDMVLFDDALSKQFATADDEIMLLKGELAKWKALAEGQEWLLKEGDEFKRSIINIYEKGLKNKTPSTEILIDIIVDTYAALGSQGDSHELAL